MSNVKLGELRINNWYESVKWKQAVMCEMSDIVQIYYIADGAKPDEDHIAMVFKPIPLTEDWLIKFGFKKDSIDSNYYLDGSRIYPIYKRGIHFNINGLSSCCKDFHFVHQLQNLYFALTGEELKIKDL